MLGFHLSELASHSSAFRQGFLAIKYITTPAPPAITRRQCYEFLQLRGGTFGLCPRNVLTAPEEYQLDPQS